MACVTAVVSESFLFSALSDCSRKFARAVPTFDSGNASVLATVFLTGILLHVGVFHWGEWDPFATKLAATFGVVYASLIAFQLFLSSRDIWNLSPLLRVHRRNLFQHGGAQILKRLQLYGEMQNLHDTYGDIVRIGPSEFPCSKGPWYNLSLPMIPLLNTRSKADHTLKRKPWAQGFNSVAIRNYEHRPPLDVSLWCNFYAFDVMGDLAFGKSFNMLKDGVKHFFLELTHRSTILSIHIMTYQREKFLDWLRQQVKERAENEPDVLSWILSASREVGKPSKEHELDLLGEANLIVVAGTAAMTCTLFELACHPEVCRKLQEEIDGYFATHETTDFSELPKLKYLQAVIDEAFRLHPTIPTYTTMRGRYSWPGKQLALMEIRHVISQIVHKYDVSFAPGQTPKAFIDGELDGFTLVCPKLDLEFETRSL
ncbi:cytochrome p450 monooxygenase [Dactylonectria macrodidyma]|uniref:Cytochrome p450 monooxygenase n=1 Tax=Dactylonectria macrodidyma TaxID=307937 RepID=A0A9P9FVM8_9HYPO|nr:cytochrome p450 monooxygenase [Dactylonectria macrodidyma]